MSTLPLTSFQASIYANVPHDWAPLPSRFSYYNPSVATLKQRGLIELQRPIPDGAWAWRRKPVTLQEAAQRLADLLPTNERALRDYFAREELLELRRVLADLQKMVSTGMVA